jgi:hypothetical protein
MNRRERRYAAKLSKKSNKELKKELNKMFPNDNREIKGEMSYQQFIDSVRLTPDMLNEINEYELQQRTNNSATFQFG